jgi:hypothetical protein
MPNGGSEALQDVLRSHTRLLLDRYAEKYGDFQTNFRWVNGFALIFLLLIIIPYVSVLHELQAVRPQLEGIEREIAQKQDSAKALGSAKAGFEALRREIDGGAMQLRNFILNDLQAAAEQVSSQSALQAQLSSDPCTQLRDETLKDCLVGSRVLAIFGGYETRLQQEVIPPLHSAGIATDELDKLADGLHALKQTVADQLREKPGFWHEFSEKVALFEALGSGVDELWRSHESQIRELEEAVGKQQAVLAEQARQLEGKRDSMREVEKSFGERLRDVETPFGHLPVGFNEALLGFPILLAVGFAICAAQLAEATRLRRSFQKLYQMEDPGRTVLTDPQVALIAPTWVDPAGEAHGAPLRVVLLLAPLVEFCVGLAIVFYVWLRTDAFGTVGILGLWTFAALYAVCFLAFLVALYQILRRKADRADAAAAVPAIAARPAGAV